MGNIRKFFDTPKKTVISVICFVFILILLGCGVAFAAGVIAEKSSIGEENARRLAFEDAGIDPAFAESVRTKFDFEYGHFVYDVEFAANGTKYEYEIHAASGEIYSKKTESFQTDSGSASGTGNTDGDIGVDQAKTIAAARAGFSASDVTFSKAKYDYDDGYMVYEVEFYKNGREYDCTINAATGEIIEFDME